MGLIALEGMRFYAYHGVHASEQKEGNWYSVDVWMRCDFSKAAASDELKDAVDYEKVYELVSIRMKTPSRLLEHIATDVCNLIKNHDAALESVRVRISKHQPPLGAEVRRSFAEVCWPEQDI